MFQKIHILAKIYSVLFWIFAVYVIYVIWFSDSPQANTIKFNYAKKQTTTLPAALLYSSFGLILINAYSALSFEMFKYLFFLYF